MFVAPRVEEVTFRKPHTLFVCTVCSIINQKHFIYSAQNHNHIVSVGFHTTTLLTEVTTVSSRPAVLSLCCHRTSNQHLFDYHLMFPPTQ